MKRLLTVGGLALAAVICVRFAIAQVPVEEAQKRLQAKLATRPATTQPVGELERLRDENNRLRVRVAELQMEVSALRDALGQGNGGRPATQASRTGPATQPAGGQMENLLVGSWRGGEPARGAGYVLEFASDGTYRRNFLQYPQRENGHYRLLPGDTLEMWTDKVAPDAPHNQYHIAIENNQLTLTPMIVEGAEVRRPTPIVLSRGA